MRFALFVSFNRTSALFVERGKGVIMGAHPVVAVLNSNMPAEVKGA